MRKIIIPFVLIACAAFLFPDQALDITYRIKAIVSIYSTILSFTLLAVTLFISISLIVRYQRKKKQIKYLMKKLKLDKLTLGKLDQKSIKKLSTESVAKLRNGNFTLEIGTASVALFDILYTLGKVDPFVLAGINHLHHGEDFKTLGDLTAFLNNEIINSSNGSDAWNDMIHKYKGYTGEEMLFNRIRENSSIIVPESGVNPDYDFIDTIADQKYNIKISSSSDYIRQARNDLPDDVNLWVNNEHAAEFSNDPRVFVDPNLSEEHIFELTNNTFSSIDSMSELINSSIPFATLAISSFRNYKLVQSGSKNKKTAVQDILIDTAGGGIGGMIGSLSSAAIWLFCVRMGRAVPPL